ncbi:MAG TPA: hypothetical protein VN345_01645 [Blastocatellia bacterium]|jgi:hypothetical protein|nr:hypothetical protein [Blastocatellia bacterium]
MDEDSLEARRKRAARLREQIATITRGKQGEPAEKDQPESGRRNAPRVHPLSPRQFIEKRMRELDRSGNERKGKEKDKAD